MKDNSDNDVVIHDTWDVIATTYRMIANQWNKELSKYNLTREQSLILAIIKHLGDSATPWAISRFQVQAHNTVSDMLNRMEKQGLVIKKRESNGKSRVKVELSKKGESAYVRSLERNSLNKIMSAVTPEELEQVKSILEKIREEALRMYEEENVWQEIRIPPSQRRNQPQT